MLFYFLLLCRFYQYYTVQNRLTEFVNTTAGCNFQSIGRDAILLNEQVFNNLCTFQTQLLVESRSTCCRVCISVDCVCSVRRFFYLAGKIWQVHFSLRRQFIRTDLEEYSTWSNVSICYVSSTSTGCCAFANCCCNCILAAAIAFIWLCIWFNSSSEIIYGVGSRIRSPKHILLCISISWLKVRLLITSYFQPFHSKKHNHFYILLSEYINISNRRIIRRITLNYPLICIIRTFRNYCYLSRTF